MERIALHEEAEKCRRRANSYEGKPEAPFLLRLAQAFDDLHVEQRQFRVRGQRD